jgi:threonine/homoserine/homoserine lactone efflux protein
MFSWPVGVLTVLTAISPGPVWLGLAWSARQGRPPGRALALLLALGQLAVLALNASSRQVVQNLELRPFFAVLEQPETVQWSPLIVFLVLFVLGAGVLGWMLWQLWQYRHPAIPSA